MSRREISTGSLPPAPNVHAANLLPTCPACSPNLPLMGQTRLKKAVRLSYPPLTALSSPCLPLPFYLWLFRKPAA